MSNLLFITRHGQTLFNTQGRLMGNLDLPLNADGEAQAADLGRKLVGVPLDRALCSPLQRARQSALIALSVAGRDVGIVCDTVGGSMGDAGFGFPLHVCEELRERNFGILEGKKREENVRLLCDWNAKIEGAESLGSFQERLNVFRLEVLLPALVRGENLLVVTHGMVLRVLMALLQGFDPHSNINSKIENCALYAYCLVGDRVVPCDVPLGSINA